MWKVKNIRLYLISFLFILITPYQAISQDKLKLGIFPLRSSKSSYKIFKPFIKILEEEILHKIKFLTTTDPIDFNQNVENGKYDLIWTCPACILNKSIQKKYKLIAQGSPSFYGGVIVKADSKITNPKQLEGKTIATVGNHSYGGYHFFRKYLKDNKIKVAKYIHIQKVDKIILSILHGKYHAGIIKLDILDSNLFKAYKTRLRVIFRSKKIPQFPFLVNRKLDNKLTKKITRGILSLNQRRNVNIKKFFHKLKIKKIKPASLNDYLEFKKIWNKARK